MVGIDSCSLIAYCRGINRIKQLPKVLYKLNTFIIPICLVSHILMWLYFRTKYTLLLKIVFHVSSASQHKSHKLTTNSHKTSKQIARMYATEGCVAVRSVIIIIMLIMPTKAINHIRINRLNDRLVNLHHSNSSEGPYKYKSKYNQSVVWGTSHKIATAAIELCRYHNLLSNIMRAKIRNSTRNIPTKWM